MQRADGTGGKEKETFFVITCKFLLLGRSRPSRNTKKSRKGCLTTPITLLDEIFKSENLHDLGSIHNPFFSSFVIDI